MKNLLLLIIVLVGGAFVGKVVIEKRYESKLDEAISLARAFIYIEYDNVKIDFDGSISINGLSITPPGFDESMSVERITAISSDRLMPIKGFDIFKNGKFPEAFELDISQLSAPIELFEQSQKSYFKNWPKTQECRSLETSFNYSAAGYQSLDSDVRVAFDFSDLYNAVVDIEVFDQALSLTFEWIFDANKVESLVRKQTSDLPVSEVSATYELEPDAAKKFVEQCADAFKVTPEVYLEKVVASAKYSQNSFGADLGPDMRQALVKFMKGGSQFSLNSKPSSQLKKLEQLQFYKAKDVLRWMNMTLALDGESIPLNAAVIVAEEDTNEEQEAKTKAPKYITKPASSAENYIGRLVRVTRTNQRKQLKGRLTGIDEDDRLQVEIGQYGGLMTLTVGFEEIDSFEVINR